VKRLHFPGFESLPGQDFFHIPKIPHWLLGRIQSAIQLFLALFLGVSCLRPDVSHLPPPRAQVNDWSYTSAPPIYLRGVVRDSFALVPSYSGKIVQRYLSVTSGNSLTLLGAL